jgi:hypothetical protein
MGSPFEQNFGGGAENKAPLSSPELENLRGELSRSWNPFERRKLAAKIKKEEGALSILRDLRLVPEAQQTQPKNETPKGFEIPNDFLNMDLTKKSAREIEGAIGAAEMYWEKSENPGQAAAMEAIAEEAEIILPEKRKNGEDIGGALAAVKSFKERINLIPKKEKSGATEITQPLNIEKTRIRAEAAGKLNELIKEVESSTGKKISLTAEEREWCINTIMEGN